MITIGNKNKGELGEYVGRGSSLGNPYKFSYDCGAERERVIEQYRNWLYRKLNQLNSEVTKEMERLYQIAKSGDLILLCWCVPKKCHAEVIKEVLEFWLNEEITKDLH